MDRQVDTDLLDPELLNKRLGDSLFSNNIVFFKKTDSTNTQAKTLAIEGSPEGTIVLAEEQTAGRGRLERRWLSHGYRNLLVSILLRPSLPIERIFILIMIMAIAVIDGIKSLSGLDAMIKWPNDLYIGRKKTGGILSEFSVKDKNIEYVILGLGLNVNWNPEEEEGLLYPVTSILTESGKKISRNELLVVILRQFEVYYREVLSGRIEPLYRTWNDHSLIMGKDIVINSKGEEARGTALRIDHQGGLVIKCQDGESRIFFSGDVSLRF